MHNLPKASTPKPRLIAFLPPGHVPVQTTTKGLFPITCGCISAPIFVTPESDPQNLKTGTSQDLLLHRDLLLRRGATTSSLRADDSLPYVETGTARDSSTMASRAGNNHQGSRSDADGAVDTSNWSLYGRAEVGRPTPFLVGPIVGAVTETTGR